jgi:hypothetical protein
MWESKYSQSNPAMERRLPVSKDEPIQHARFPLPKPTEHARHPFRDKANHAALLAYLKMRLESGLTCQSFLANR